MAALDHFIIAGAQRCGTSYLARFLDLHPEILLCKPLRPEPKFFLRAEAVTATVDDYGRLFPSDARGARLAGEKSTSYIERVEAPARIRRLLPEARIIFVLRDPVERAISNYRFSVENGAETTSMDEAFRNEERRRERYDRARYSVSPFGYLRRGHYEEHLCRFEEHFPREQLAILLFERLVRDPAPHLRRLLSWLGVDPGRQPPPPRRPENARRRAGTGPSRPLRRFLVEYFSEPNRRLADRFGLDLSDWQVPTGREAAMPTGATGGTTA